MKPRKAADQNKQSDVKPRKTRSGHKETKKTCKIAAQRKMQPPGTIRVPLVCAGSMCVVCFLCLFLFVAGFIGCVVGVDVVESYSFLRIMIVVLVDSPQ